MSSPSSPTTRAESSDRWPTAITQVEPDKVLVRGYRLDELMGRVSFSDAIYVLLTGELPDRTVGRLMDALFISSIDHGATPPATIAARNVAATGAPLRAAAAAGLLSLGSRLGGGGSIESCMRFLNDGLALVGDWVSHDDAARRLLDQLGATGQTPPGFGHRHHRRDPRAARLMQLAFELELEGGRTQLARAVEQELIERRSAAGLPAASLNVDGAIAAIAGDLGLDAETATMLFTIARVPGLVAHAIEETRRQEAMRMIDPSKHVYDGPAERRVHESPLLG